MQAQVIAIGIITAMASSVRLDISQNQLITGKHALGGSTANLIRLLRESEEGKGLDIDYAEALEKTLSVNQYIGRRYTNTKRKTGWRQQRSLPIMRMKT